MRGVASSSPQVCAIDLSSQRDNQGQTETPSSLAYKLPFIFASENKVCGFSPLLGKTRYVPSVISSSSLFYWLIICLQNFSEKPMVFIP